MTLTDEQKADLIHLMTIPGFRRSFMLPVIQMAGIFHATANGSDQRTSFNDGRRSLGLELLQMLEAALPLQAPSGLPSLTVIQVLREEAQSPTPQRTKNGRRSDPYSELGTGSDDASDAAAE